MNISRAKEALHYMRINYWKYRFDKASNFLSYKEYKLNKINHYWKYKDTIKENANQVTKDYMNKYWSFE